MSGCCYFTVVMSIVVVFVTFVIVVFALMIMIATFVLMLFCFMIMTFVVRRRIYYCRNPIGIAP